MTIFIVGSRYDDSYWLVGCFEKEAQAEQVQYWWHILFPYSSVTLFTEKIY